VVHVIVMDCRLTVVKEKFSFTKCEFGQFYLSLNELCTFFFFFLLIPSDILTDIVCFCITSFTNSVH